ncbi:MAG: 3-methyl-2-oxobutanoate hydroxymethyltransferase [Thermoleophilia bacterium]
MYGPGDHNPLSPARTGRTAADIAASKGERRLAMLTAYDYPTALALDGCGLDLILVGDSLGEVELDSPAPRRLGRDDVPPHPRAVAHGATRTHIVGMPADSYRTRGSGRHGDASRRGRRIRSSSGAMIPRSERSSMRESR